MSTPTLDDFMALNDQIAALVQADVPLELNLGRSKKSTLDALTRINAVVARRVGQGMTLSEALEQEDSVITPTYRSLMRLSLESGDLSAGLVEANRTAESGEEIWCSVRLSGTYPLILACLAYFGLIGFTLFLTPRIDNLYRTLQMEPGFGLSLLRLLSATFPLWVVLAPVGLGALLFVLRMRSKRAAANGGGAALIFWIPGASTAAYQQKCATFSQSLATLLEAGQPLDEALRVSAGTWNDPAMEEHLRAHGSAAEAETLPEHRWLAARLPPFLQWALWHSTPTIQRPRALNMAAKLYRDSSQQWLGQLRTVAPIVACVVIGGGITLLYGLTLFVPLVEMLKSLAS